MSRRRYTRRARYTPPPPSSLPPSGPPTIHELPDETRPVAWSLSFPSIEAMLVRARGEKTPNLSTYASTEGAEYFTQTRSFDEACTLAERGWADGAARVSAIVDRITKASPTVAHFQTYHDTSGSYVDVDRYISGEPECMVEFAPDTRVKPTVRIGFQLACSAGETTDSIMARGATVAALVNALEDRNVRCEVVATLAIGEPMSAASGGVLYVETLVKRAEQPLDIDRLAFATAHPSMLRRLMFAVMETAPAEICVQFSVGCTYGSVRSTRQPGFDIFIGNKVLASWDADSALHLINATLDKFGGV